MSLADELQGLVLKSKLPRGTRRVVKLATPEEAAVAKKRAGWAAASKRYRERHAAAVAAANEAWRKANPAKVRALDRKWKRDNPAKVRRSINAWNRRKYAENPAAARARVAEYRDRVKAGEVMRPSSAYLPRREAA